MGQKVDNNYEDKLNTITTSSSLSVAHPTPTAWTTPLPSAIFKADTGASAHYVKKDDTSILYNIKPSKHPKQVQLPDESIIKSTHDANLPINGVNISATTATVFPALTSSSLLSIGQLCNDDCIAVFTKENMKVLKDEKIILHGIRNQSDGLWDVPLHTPMKSIEKANAIINKNQSKQQLAEYYHRCCFSPNIRTFTEAIKNGNFMSWPALQSLNLYRHMKKTMATSMGHLDQEYQGLQSTKTKAVQHLIENEKLDLETKQCFFPQMSNIPTKTYDCVAQLVPFEAKNKGYMDLTGRFPYKSSSGNEYILIVYDYDSNAILAEALSSRQGAEIKRGWKTINEKLKSRGNTPNIYVLDNECSHHLKTAMTEESIQWQLATPYLHRTNAAERAIRTFKNHFLAGLATTHSDFPISEWDRLLPQAVITLNLLRNSRVNPKLSAYSYLFGPYDFNACPMAPPGTLVAVHTKPNKRKSWDPHAKRGWYIGPSLSHYRNFRIFLPNTKSEIVSDTVDLFADTKEIPTISNDEFIQQALMDILAVLQNKQKINVPSLHYREKINDAIILVSDLLGKANKKPILQPPSKPQPIDPPEETLAHLSKIPTTNNTQSPRVQTVFTSVASLPRVITKDVSTHSQPSYKALAAQYLNITETFKFKMHHVYNSHEKKETLDSLLK